MDRCADALKLVDERHAGEPFEFFERKRDDFDDLQIVCLTFDHN